MAQSCTICSTHFCIFCLFFIYSGGFWFTGCLWNKYKIEASLAKISDPVRIKKPITILWTIKVEKQNTLLMFMSFADSESDDEHEDWSHVWNYSRDFRLLKNLTVSEDHNRMKSLWIDRFLNLNIEFIDFSKVWANLRFWLDTAQTASLVVFFFYSFI